VATSAFAFETEQRVLNPSDVRRGVQRLIEGPVTRVYVATSGEEEDPIVVFVAVSGWEWSEWTARSFLWLGAAYVQPEWRDRKLIGRILDEVERYARTKGIDSPRRRT
jgi:GNAT superfamily N-acetyltransferase